MRCKGTLELEAGSSEAVQMGHRQKGKALEKLSEDKAVWGCEKREAAWRAGFPQQHEKKMTKARDQHYSKNEENGNRKLKTKSSGGAWWWVSLVVGGGCMPVILALDRQKAGVGTEEGKLQQSVSSKPI